MNKYSVFYIISFFFNIFIIFGISTNCLGEGVLNNSNLSFNYISYDGRAFPINGVICLHPGSTIKIKVRVPEGALVTYDNAREGMVDSRDNNSPYQIADNYRWRVVLSNGNTFFPGDINQCQTHPLILHQGIFYISMPFLGVIQFDVVKPDMSAASSIFFSSIGSCQMIDIESYISYKAVFTTIRMKELVSSLTNRMNASCKHLPYPNNLDNNTSLVSPFIEKCNIHATYSKCPTSAARCIFNVYYGLWQVLQCG